MDRPQRLAAAPALHRGTGLPGGPAGLAPPGERGLGGRGAAQRTAGGLRHEPVRPAAGGGRRGAARGGEPSGGPPALPRTGGPGAQPAPALPRAPQPVPRAIPAPQPAAQGAVPRGLGLGALPDAQRHLRPGLPGLQRRGPPGAPAHREPLRRPGRGADGPPGVLRLSGRGAAPGNPDGRRPAFRDPARHSGLERGAPQPAYSRARAVVARRLRRTGAARAFRAGRRAGRAAPAGLPEPGGGEPGRPGGPQPALPGQRGRGVLQGGQLDPLRRPSLAADPRALRGPSWRRRSRPT